MTFKLIRNTILIFSIIAAFTILPFICSPAHSQQPQQKPQPLYHLQGDATFMYILMKQLEGYNSFLKNSDLPYKITAPKLDSINYIYSQINNQLFIQDSLRNAQLKVDTTSHKK